MASYLFEAEPNGTRLTSRVELEGAGFFGLLDPVIGVGLRREMKAALPALKALLEIGPRQMTPSVTAIRQRAWWALAAIAVTLVVFGVTDVATGAKADPGISLAVVGKDPAALEAAQPDAYRMFDFLTRSQGFVLGMFGLLVLAVATIPYRAGQPWAWRVLWLLPAWAIVVPFLYLDASVRPRDSRRPRR